MRLFNRIVVSLLLLALAAGAIGVIVLAWTIPEDSIRGLRDAVDWLDDNNEDLQKVVLTTGGALVALIALTILVFELAPSAGTEVKVTDVKTADAVLSTSAIGQRIEEAVRGVPNIAEVKAAVRSRRKGVLVSLDLHVDPDANLAAAAESACEAARQVLADRLHVELVEQPKVRLHYRELRLQRGAPPAARPAPPEAQAEAGPAQDQGVRVRAEAAGAEDERGAGEPAVPTEAAVEGGAESAQASSKETAVTEDTDATSPSEGVVRQN